MKKIHIIIIIILISIIFSSFFFFLGRNVEKKMQESLLEITIAEEKLQEDNYSAKLKQQCRPALNDKVNNYVIGYGSLMNKESRQITVPSAKFAIPILVKGYERLWASRGSTSNATYLLAVPHKDYVLNAIYYKSTAVDISATDLREASYCRVRIAKKDIIPLGIKNLPKGDFWMYVKNIQDAEFPNKEFPILQSYADVFMTGCLQTQAEFNLTEFGKLCFTTTYNWDLANWVYDRSNPRYARYSDNTKQYSRQIDTIISRMGLDTENI